EPVFLKVPMVAILKSPFAVFEPAPLRPQWRSTGRRRSLAHPRLRGLDSTGGTFLLARGMTASRGPHRTWGPSGEESCDDAVASKRSKRAPRADLRPDQAIEEAVWSGQRYGRTTQILAI